jgi:hypothetical protein
LRCANVSQLPQDAAVPRRFERRSHVEDFLSRHATVPLRGGAIYASWVVDSNLHDPVTRPTRQHRTRRSSPLRIRAGAAIASRC